MKLKKLTQAFLDECIYKPRMFGKCKFKYVYCPVCKDIFNLRAFDTLGLVPLSDDEYYPKKTICPSCNRKVIVEVRKSDKTQFPNTIIAEIHTVDGRPTRRLCIGKVIPDTPEWNEFCEWYENYREELEKC